MKRTIHIILKVILSLILIMPILGMTGIFPEPTRDLYNTDAAFAFIQMLADAQYVNIMISVVFALAVIFLWTRREALAALLITPITANIVGFHAFLDGGLHTPGAIMGNVLLAITVYFLWKYRSVYKTLFVKR